MNHPFRIIPLALCAALLFFSQAGLAAEAEERLSVTIVNGTQLELLQVGLVGKSKDGDGISIRSNVNIVPSNRFTIETGSASRVMQIRVDLGLAVCSFPDLSALADKSKMTLTLSLSEDDEPAAVLELAEEGKNP